MLIVHSLSDLSLKITFHITACGSPCASWPCAPPGPPFQYHTHHRPSAISLGFFLILSGSEAPIMIASGSTFSTPSVPASFYLVFLTVSFTFSNLIFPVFVLHMIYCFFLEASLWILEVPDQLVSASYHPSSSSWLEGWAQKYFFVLWGVLPIVLTDNYNLMEIY